MRRELSAVALLILVHAAFPASAQTLNVGGQLESRLERFGKFAVLGRWNGNACALTGIAPLEYLQVIDLEGTLLNGISIGGPATVLGSGALGEDKETFQNCNATSSQAGGDFSLTVTKELSLVFKNSFSPTLDGKLTVPGGVFGYALVAIGIGGSKTWSTSTTTTQTTSIPVTMSKPHYTSVPPRSELDISYKAVSNRVRLPILASGKFDATIYPCQEFPKHAHQASDLLSDPERTFTASGTIEFDDVQEGTFLESVPRPTSCPTSGVHRLRSQLSVGKWTSQGYVQETLPAR